MSKPKVIRKTSENDGQPAKGPGRKVLLLAVTALLLIGGSSLYWVLTSDTPAELSLLAGKWQRPDGGYFFWLRFDDDVDTALLRDRAGELETGFQPGSVFSSDGKLRNFLRLSFAHYHEDDIREGIARMRPIFD